jgi:CubicO group peptidase (beta-lactamase class C family)
MKWLAVVLAAGIAAPVQAQFPGKDWPTGTPESQGLSSAGVDAAAAFAEKHGGGSGCIIRHGVLVREWGDPKFLADIKSATKGSVGITVLGLAVDAGLVKLDDLATKYDPDLGTEKKENVEKGWLKDITIRQLATMTAGFDDGRPPLLAYKPGTKGIYSNDTSNMLAEVVGAKFNEDLKAVLKRKVMDPIGVPEREWVWRDNSFRPKTRNGLVTREFASGIRITHRALARIGWLYLNDGQWDGKQILSREFVRAATRPTDLPAPFPYYGFYWGTNGRGTFKGMPKDTFWAFGLGDSFVVVCPSLDIVAVRLGVGSKKSQLPDDGTDNWGGRVESFFAHIVKAVRDQYPPCEAIRGINWESKEKVVRLAKGSDNWPATWGDDDTLYTAYGDGNGFKPFVPEKLSLGLARVTGAPPDHRGENLRSATLEKKGDGAKGEKASGLLMVDGVLYLWVRNAGNARLAWSKDRGPTWEWADWRFETSFGCPTFLNFGKNYAGARDEFVYVYSHDSDSAYKPADRMVFARVPKGKVREKAAYEFFAGPGKDGKPTWSSDVTKRAAVFEHKGKCYRSGITYHAAAKQYLWCQTLPGDEPRFRGGFGVYAAPEPWGPWTTVYFTEEWDTGPGETSSLPTKWISADGRTAWLLFSGDDHFSARKATLRLADGGK